MAERKFYQRAEVWLARAHLIHWIFDLAFAFAAGCAAYLRHLPWWAVSLSAFGAAALVIVVIVSVLHCIDYWKAEITASPRNGLGAVVARRHMIVFLLVAMGIAGAILLATALVGWVLNSSGTFEAFRTSPLPQAETQTVGQPPQTTPSVPVRSPADADKEIAVIDDVYDLLRNSEPISGEGMRVESGWWNAWVDPKNNPDYDQAVNNFTLRFANIGKSMQTLKDKTPQYFDGDLSTIVDTFNFEEANRSIDSWVGVIVTLKMYIDISQLKSSGSGNYDINRIIGPHNTAFEKTMTVLHDWIYNSKNALSLRRKQLSDIAARAK